MSLQSKTFADLVNFARASTATYVDADGTIKTAAVDAPRFDWSTGRRALLLEASATNLCLAYAAPNALGPVYKSGDAAAVLSVVADATVPGGSGGVTEGRVYRLDNSLGTTEARIVLTGTFDSTRLFAMSCYARRVGGAGNVRMRAGYGDYFLAPAASAGAAWSRIWCNSTHKSSGGYSTADTMWVKADAGCIAHVAMPQIEVDVLYPSSYIPTTGTAATRAADIASIKGLTAGTFDRRLVTPSGTADTSGVVHPGGDIALAPGVYYQSIYY